MTPFNTMVFLSFLMVVFGTMKLSSSKSLVSMLISMEMVMVGVFCSLSMKFWLANNVHVIVVFLVLVVVEGVMGLLIITHLFREMGVKSSVGLFY